MMRRALTVVAAVSVLAGCGGPRRQIRFVDLDSGSGRTQSGTFHPTGSWKMTYSWDCARQRSQGIKELDRLNLEIFNADDGSSSFETPEVHETGPKGEGSVDYRRSGWYYISIESPCDWRLVVLDTSRS